MGTKRRPVVLDETTGEYQLLQPGDFIQEVDMPTMTNGNASSIVRGMAVYITVAGGTVDKAQANAAGTTPAWGLVADASIANGASGVIQTEGVLTATTGEFDAVTGDTGGLTPGSTYWLSSATAGRITKTFPSSAAYAQKVGVALSTTMFKIEIGDRIKL